jgi:uncharacterized membrane protein
MQQHVRDAVDFLVPIVDAIGAFVIAVGVAIAFATWILSELRVRRVSYERVRLVLGRFLALGLEFQLGADLLGTAVSPTYSEIGKLAAVAAIRTILNYFLAQELERATRVEAHEGAMTEPTAP